MGAQQRQSLLGVDFRFVHRQTDTDWVAQKLTLKQRKFIAAYDGNATDAARKAGYKGNDVTLQAVASENLRKPLIAAALKGRTDKQVASVIANREERQKFWTDAMRGLREDVDPLRASELLAKSDGDFIEKVEVSGQLTLESAVLLAVAKRKPKP